MVNATFPYQKTRPVEEANVANNLRLVFTSDGVGVAIRSVELYGIVKTAF